MQGRSLGLFSSEATRGREIKKNGRLKRIFPEFKWIIYNFNNNRKNTQKTFDMRLVPFFWYIKTTLGGIIRVESVYVLYFAWFLHAHLNK